MSLPSIPSGSSLQGGDTSAQGGNSAATSGTGQKEINIGGNPNVKSFLSPQVIAIAGVVLIVGFLALRK